MLRVLVSDTTNHPPIDGNTHFETPRIPFKVFIALTFRDVEEELLHLLAKADVQATQIGKSGNSQVKVKDMVLVAGQQLPQKSGLDSQRTSSG